MQCRRIVHTVADHGHDLTLLTQRLGDPQLVLGTSLGKDDLGVTRQRPLQGALWHSAHLRTGENPIRDIPTSRQTSAAVSRWSPVRTSIRIPAQQQARTASETSGRRAERRWAGLTGSSSTSIPDLAP